MIGLLHENALRRTKVGKFHVRDAILLDNLVKLVHKGTPLQNMGGD
ncbi:MAG: hypothetical protein WCJ33_02770 [Pseudomonadota bacterium]